MEGNKMGLYQKIYNVMSEAGSIEKDMVVGSGNSSYHAVSEKEMLNKVKPLFIKYKLAIIPVEGDISEKCSTYEKYDSFKKTTVQTIRAITSLKTYYKLIDIETGESEVLVGFGNGADSQDKGAGKASTYSYKNVLSKSFMIFSGDDTDNDHSDDITKQNTTVMKKFEVTTEMANEIAKLVEETESNSDKLCEVYKISNYNELSEADYIKLMNQLNYKLDKKRNKK